jgi:hypothetical protein
MSHRREQKEALRRERERREAEARAAQQRKRMVGIVGAAVLAVATLAVLVVVATGSGGGGGGDGSVKGSGNTFPTGGSIPAQKVFDLKDAVAAAGGELKSNPATSRDHVQDPDQKINYPQNPPTSGKHFAVPAEDGLYNGTPPKDTALVHELEHGRVIIWVKPSAPREVREKIRALFDEDSYQMVVVSRSDMPYEVAATAWSADPTPLGTGQTLSFTKWSDGVIDALRTFRDEHRSNGPEPIP